MPEQLPKRDGPLKVAFLLGSDSDSTRLAVESVCALPNVQVTAALLDTEKIGFQRRFRNLRKNIRRAGWKYLPLRIAEGLRDLTDRLVEDAVVDRAEVLRVLGSALPGRCQSLPELSRKYGFPISEVGNLNSPEAVRALRAAGADLGIVLGTRILKEHVFSVPVRGCINLHKGKVPEYRGMPPGFWEIYDGAQSAGVTVHYVDRNLDTGDIVTASEIPVSSTDTPETLRQKLHEEGARLLATAVSAIQAGTAGRLPQIQSQLKPRTKPTVRQVRQLQSRLPHWSETPPGQVVLKNLYCLLVYYSGLYLLVRLWHRWTGVRGCVLLYHRVNDFSRDPLTVDTRTFAAQLLSMAKRYPFLSTTGLVARLRRREKVAATSIAIHFDDCYRDVFLNGAPILKTIGLPATAFISSGFVDTDRAFEHDRSKYPWNYLNLRAEDVRAWVAAGFEVGAHTVNHVDLGKCSLEEATFEVVESRRELESVISGNGATAGAASRPVAFFSFPFGRVHNIRADVVSIIRESGYEALFSAHGGFVGSRTDLFDIPRMGCSGGTRPLYLLLEIEGLGPGQLASALQGVWSFFRSGKEPLPDVRTYLPPPAG